MAAELDEAAEARELDERRSLGSSAISDTPGGKQARAEDGEAAAVEQFLIPHGAPAATGRR